MTQADQTATNDTREVSPSRVSTQDTVLASLTTAAASEQPVDNTEGEQNEGEKKVKPTSERWQKLANERRDALEKANAANAENAELRRRLEALEARASAPEADPEPQRTDFASEGDYLKAAAKWLAKQEIAAERQREDEARNKALHAELEQNFAKRRERAAAEIEDFTETLAESTVSIPDNLVPALLESEHGPYLAYYLAKNPEEARRLKSMSTAAGIKYLLNLERELDTDDPQPTSTPKQRPRPPEPISPVRGAPASTPGKAKSFQEYKAMRQAQRSR